MDRQKPALRRFTDRLYGGLNMSWLTVILFAVGTAVLTAVFLILPVFKNTSFNRMGVYLEAWIFFAVIIMTNSKNPLESALKTFVFFLISQPLIYLLQVPFSWLGFGIFQYYRYWFIVTLLTFPMAFIGWYIRKKNWLSLLILAPVLYLLTYTYVYSFTYTIGHFPYLLVTALFCLAQVLLYLYAFTSDTWQKLTGFLVPLAIAIVLRAMTPQAVLSVQDNLPGNPRLSSDVTVTVEDPSVATMEIITPEDARYHLTAQKYGTTSVIVKDAQQELHYDFRAYQDDDGVAQIELTPAD